MRNLNPESGGTLIKENCLVQWDGSVDQIERVLWIEPGEDRLHVISIGDDQRAWPVIKKVSELQAALADGRALVLQRDHVVARLRQDTALTEKQKQARDKAWQTIVDLVHDPERKIFKPGLRGKLIKETASKRGVDVTSVYKYLRRYWQRGQTLDALQPELYKCGGPGKRHTAGEVKLGRPRVYGPKEGMNMTDVDREHCYQIVKRYFVGKKLTMMGCYDKLLAEHYISGYEERNGTPVPILKPEAERPTFSQFRYFVNHHFGRMELERARSGESNYQRNLRPVLGDQTRLADGPGDIYQIDATTADIHLVHSKQTGVVVGRPIVYLVIDTFSQMVVGLHVTYHSASYNAAAMAIWNAYRDKVEWCAEYGLQIKPDEWPVHGIPQQLYADRGEMVCTQTDQLIAQLGLRIANTPPYRADAKGIVERFFHTMNQLVVKWLPGALPDDFEERGQPDYRKKAQLTKHEFTTALLLAVLAYNKSLRSEYIPTTAMIRDKVPMTPLKIWQWGTLHRSCLRQMDRAWVRFKLLPVDKATITVNGYRFANLHYTSPESIEQEVFSSARAYGNKTVDISYDPNLMDHIYIRGKTLEDLQVCNLTDAYRQFAGWGKVQVDAYWKEKRQQDQLQRNDDLGVAIQSQAQINAIVVEANRRRKIEGLPDIKQMRAAMEEDRQLEAQKAAAQTLEILGTNKLAPPPVPEKKQSKVEERFAKYFAEQGGTENE